MTRAAEPEPLARYRGKRDFSVTPEPGPAKARQASAGLAYVIQKHWASRLHYDFRLEWNGVLLSWAVPKGPSFDPSEKRMAVRVEDHPVGYAGFEGDIPKGQYGAGTVIVWDRGTWEPVGDPAKALADGKLVFRLHGQKLAGLWELVRIARPGDRQDAWMLFKKRDEWARPLADYDVISALPDSVVAHPLGAAEAREPRGTPAAEPAGQAPDLSKARKASLPATLAPQLATLATALPASGRWSLEPKWDGYRILARIDRTVRLLTRNGNDWTAQLPALADAVGRLGLRKAWLDGELVALSPSGTPDFNRLQNAIGSGATGELVYFAFDLPFHDGLDLRAVPLEQRRRLLGRLLEAAGSEAVRFSQHFDAPVGQMLQAACAMGLEGLVAKQLDAPYESRRTPSWLKLKCVQRQEFVVVGFNDRQGAAREVGSLLLALREGRTWRYCGSVGTGWDGKTGRELHARLSKSLTRSPAVDPATVKPGRWSRRAGGGEQWVRPELVVEVSFTEWTPDGHVRHPVFKGVRSDKRAEDVVLETPVPAAGGAADASAAPRTAVKVSHPQRVIDPSTGLTKLHLVRYYESVAPWMLRHLAERPVSLVRAPQGIAGEHFFQKHPETRMPGMTVLDPALWPGHAALLAVDSAEALVAAAQMNVVEFHTWNSTTRDIDRPDRIVFDLDPGDGVAWPRLQEAATLVRDFLHELGLRSWLKSSGGKGLHVVVPLQPQWDYARVKDFSREVVEHLARVVPARFVARSGAANRVGRIYVDYLRNGHGQTTAAAFSARARPGLGVSMPVAWEELADMKSGAQWTIATAREHLSFQRSDPWEGYFSTSQTLDEAQALLRG